MSGSVKKNGSTWYYILELGKDLNGKRKQKKKRGFKTKKEAQNALIEVENELLKGTYIEPTKLILSEYMKEWLEDKKTKVRPSTHQTYKWLVEKHIIPAIGHFEMVKLTPLIIQQLYNRMINENVLSDENIQKIHTLINDALKRAERWGMITKNVAALVDRPKASKKEIHVWDIDEVKTFLSYAESERLYPAFHLALTTGMRQGEILGLRWKDVNFHEHSLHILQTLSHDGKTLSIGTKTRAGMRRIDLPAETVDVLQNHKKLIEQEKEDADDIYQNNDLVICTTIGTPVSPSNLSRTYRAIIKRSGLSPIRFHDLRHTHATLLLKQGVNPKIVAERLGHADIRITLDTYSHLLPSMQKETARNFGKMLFG